MEHFFIIVAGPTAVGKTTFIRQLIQKSGGNCPIEVINGDMGQLYTPLTIGTAKPQWQDEPVKHHLFDILDQPCNYSVSEYRIAVKKSMEHIWSNNKVPVIVGGSEFYLKSLLYPVYENAEHKEPIKIPDMLCSLSTQELWDKLMLIDSVRAQQIHPHDRYRITRALALWYTMHIKPSALSPSYIPLGKYSTIYLTRERVELYMRIEERVKQMFADGWLEEVKSLSPEWHTFLCKKKLIGYSDIIEYLNYGQKNGQKRQELQELMALISHKTKAYAKRQETFWRSWKRELIASDTQGLFLQEIRELNLSLPSSTLYEEQLLKTIVYYIKTK